MLPLPLNFELTEYDYGKFEWYNPVFVLSCYGDLLKKYPGREDHHLFKKAKEAAHGATALLGARMLHGNNVYIMQMNRQSQRPDVIAATLDGPVIKVSPLEMTEMELHTTDKNISKSLFNKFKKNYPPEIIFILIVNKILEYNIHDVVEQIKPANKSNPIYIVGKAKDDISTSFFIASPQPIVAKADFDLTQQGREYPYPLRMSLHEDKTIKNPVWKEYQVKPIDLFEFFMLNRTRIEKAFG